jgi:phage baseplate assembly protein W
MIDKQLTSSMWYSLSNNWDFITITDEESVLQAVQNRILSKSWTWTYDDSFGSLLDNLKDTPIQAITSTQIEWYVKTAVQPLIDDWRVVSVREVKILEKTNDSIQVEIKIELQSVEWLLEINLNL